jgi:hypothetical protein
MHFVGSRDHFVGSSEHDARLDRLDRFGQSVGQSFGTVKHGNGADDEKDEKRDGVSEGRQKRKTKTENRKDQYQRVIARQVERVQRGSG